MKLIKYHENLKIHPSQEMCLGKGYNKHFLKYWKELSLVCLHKVEENILIKNLFKLIHRTFYLLLVVCLMELIKTLKAVLVSKLLGLADNKNMRKWILVSY